MRHSFDLENPDRLPDGMGGYVVQWRRLGTLWAEVKAQSGRAERGEVATQARVRWRLVVPGVRVGDPRRPHPGQRLRMGARLFTIEAVAEVDPMGRDLMIWASEQEGRR